MWIGGFSVLLVLGSGTVLKACDEDRYDKAFFDACRATPVTAESGDTPFSVLRRANPDLNSYPDSEQGAAAEYIRAQGDATKDGEQVLGARQGVRVPLLDHCGE